MKKESWAINDTEMEIGRALSSKIDQMVKVTTIQKADTTLKTTFYDVNSAVITIQTFLLN